MRLGYVLYSIGLAMSYFGIFLCVPIIVALCYHEISSVLPFLITGVSVSLIGILLKQFSKAKGQLKNLNDIKRNEGLFTVVVTWLFIGFISAIPYLMNGISFENAFFEATSGITTTGATVLTNINYSHSLLFWRSLTQWIGGMGIIVLFIAILPQFAIAGRQMFYAEIPGPVEDKFTPRIRNTASMLWRVYFGLTIVECICLLCAGMPLFDAICNSLSTIAAGGLSPNPESIMGYHSNYITWIIMFFIFLSGSSFSLQYKAYTKFNPFLMWKNEEFRVYTGIFLTLAFIVATSLVLNDHFQIFDAITHGMFQVISLMTTTASISTDYSQWSFTTQTLLVLAMLTGACATSASGGIKIMRCLLIFKIVKVQLKKILHPNGVFNIRVDNKIIQKDVLSQTVIFVLFYIFIMLISILLITLIEGNTTVGITSSISAIGNIGQGLGHIIGPTGSYATLSPLTKFILIFDMYIGRLELIPFLVFLEPDFYGFRR